MKIKNTSVIQADNLPGSKWKSYVFYENVANSSWIPSDSPYKTKDDVSVPGWSSYLCDYVDGSKGKLKYNVNVNSICGYVLIENIGVGKKLKIYFLSNSTRV